MREVSLNLSSSEKILRSTRYDGKTLFMVDNIPVNKSNAFEINIKLSPMKIQH